VTEEKLNVSLIVVLLTASKPADVGAVAAGVAGATSAAGNAASQPSFCSRAISLPLLVNISAPSGSLKTV